MTAPDISVELLHGGGLPLDELNPLAVKLPQGAMLAPGSNFVGYVGDDEDNASRQGRWRWSGGKAQTNVTTPNASCTLSNPALKADGVTPNDVDLILTRYQVEVDASADVVILHDAVSSGALRKNTNPNRRTTVANPGECRVGAGVLSGGEPQDYTRRAGTNSPVAVGPFRHRITPGTTWTVRFLGPGATNNVWFVIGWFVVAAGGDLM